MSFGVAEAIQIAQAAGTIIPLIIAGIDAAVSAGEMSPEDGEILKRDITSRKAAYMRAKAEDERALAVKHGTPDELAVADAEPPELPANPYRDADDS
jgi:hypothetical protein